MSLKLQCSSKDKQKKFKKKGSRREANLINRKVREEDLLAHLSDRFIEVENLDDAIETSLAEIGRFTRVDRCRVCAFNEDFSRLNSLYEWCADGIESCIEELQDIRIGDSLRGIEGLQKNKVNMVDDINSLPADFPVNKEYFTRQGVKSFIDVPLFSGKRLVGLVGFQTVRKTRTWRKEEITLLKLFSNSLWHELKREESQRELRESMKSLEISFKDTIRAMGKIQEMRDPYTSGHQKKVADFCSLIAEKLNLPKEKREAVYYAALVHDIGKIYIPSEILNKPGKLSKIEFELIKAHPGYGADVLRTVNFPWPLADIVLQHHERLDGSGYPCGLKGEQICIEARIITVADVFDAMTSHRPYRAGLGIDLAMEELKKNRGIFYDSVVVDAFSEIV